MNIHPIKTRKQQQTFSVVLQERVSGCSDAAERGFVTLAAQRRSTCYLYVSARILPPGGAAVATHGADNDANQKLSDYLQGVIFFFCM